MKNSAIKKVVLVPAFVPLLALVTESCFPTSISTTLFFIKGAGAWNLCEYCMHRWLLHSNSYNAVEHRHKYFGIIVWTGCAGLSMYAAISLMKIHAGWAAYFLAISVSGFVTTILSVALNCNKIRNLRKSWTAHYNSAGTCCYGITCCVWDKWFNTYPDKTNYTTQIPVNNKMANIKNYVPAVTGLSVQQKDVIVN